MKNFLKGIFLAQCKSQNLNCYCFQKMKINLAFYTISIYYNIIKR